MSDGHRSSHELEDSLRCLVSHKSLRRALWDGVGGARQALMGTLVEEVGQEQARRISLDVNLHLSAMSTFRRIAGHFRQTATHAVPLDVVTVIAAIRKLSDTRLDEAAQMLRLRAVIWCAVHYLLSVKDFVAGFANAKKMLAIDERPDESLSIAETRSAGLSLIKGWVRLGLRDGHDAVVREAAIYERERPLAKLVDDLTRYAEGGSVLRNMESPSTQMRNRKLPRGNQPSPKNARQTANHQSPRGVMQTAANYSEADEDIDHEVQIVEQHTAHTTRDDAVKSIERTKNVFDSDCESETPSDNECRIVDDGELGRSNKPPVAEQRKNVRLRGTIRMRVFVCLCVGRNVERILANENYLFSGLTGRMGGDSSDIPFGICCVEDMRVDETVYEGQCVAALGSFVRFMGGFKSGRRKFMRPTDYFKLLWRKDEWTESTAYIKKETTSLQEHTH